MWLGAGAAIMQQLLAADYQIRPHDVERSCHCIHPAYLSASLHASLVHLGLRTVREASCARALSPQGPRSFSPTHSLLCDPLPPPWDLSGQECKGTSLCSLLRWTDRPCSLRTSLFT